MKLFGSKNQGKAPDASKGRQTGERSAAPKQAGRGPERSATGQNKARPARSGQARSGGVVRGHDAPNPPRRQAPQKKGKTPRKQGMGRGRLAITIAVAAVAVLFVVTAIAGNAVSKKDTIYPKVTVDGIDIGGLTMAEAAQKLEARGFAGFEGQELKINLPMERTLTISAEEAGIEADSSDAAIFAYEYGRDGNIFSNLISYLGCVFSGRELDYETKYSIDEEMVRDKISEAVKDVNAELMDGDVEIVEGEYISIIKGAQAMIIDPDEIFQIVDEAFKIRDFDEIDYEPEPDDEEALDVDGLYDTVFVEPVDSEYDPETGDVTEHVDGVSFDKGEALALWDMTRHGEEVIIPLIITEPEITSEYLKSVLFKDVLSSKSTNLTYSYARNNNITKVCEAINGLVLNPGETFSFNGTVGQRTAGGGYMAAGAYSGNTSVQEIGGGICQASSTLYYTVLYANLEIVERYCHSMAVSYLPPGLDATVSWPNPDFKFKNDRDYPIKIEAYTDLSNYTVSIKIYGTDADGSYVVMRSDSWVTATGTEAVTYRDVYDKNGSLISTREEARSRYSYAETSTPEPEESEEPTDEPTESPEVSSSPEPPVTEQPTTPVDPPPVTENPEPPPIDPPPDGNTGGEEAE